MTKRMMLAASAAAAVMLVSSSCSQDTKKAGETPAPEVSLASTVYMADPRTSAQLLRGFYPVEGNAWRWTAGKFAVALRPPVDAAQKGARLAAKFTIPDSSMTRLKSMTLSASVGGTVLAPETYTKAGEYTYTRDVPASALAGSRAVVEFSLDKFIPAGAVEARELGVVAASVGFDPVR